MRKIIFLWFIILGGWYYPDDDHKNLMFGVVTDVQYCNCDSEGSRYYKSSLAKLNDCIKYFNTQKLDFVTHLGDLIDHDFTSYDSVLIRFNNLKAPVYYVLGNHDYSVKEIKKIEVPKKMQMNRSYYSKVIGAWQFIFLNGDELSFFAPHNKIQSKETREMVFNLVGRFKCNVVPWNGGISGEQIEWLKMQLTLAERSNKKVIIMCHFPLLPLACHNLWNDEEVVSLLTKHKCVKAYFCGHNHKGDYVLKDGIHYITFKGMVETADTASFAKVTLTQDSIFVEGHGKEISRRLKLF